MVHQVEKNLKEHGDKISARRSSGEAEAAVAAAKSAMEGTDAEALKPATERLSQAAMKIGEAMYKAAGRRSGAGRAAAAGGPAAVRARRPAATTRWSTPSSRKSTTRRRSRPDRGSVRRGMSERSRPRFGEAGRDASRLRCRHAGT